MVPIKAYGHSVSIYKQLTRGYEVPCGTVTELVEHTVTVRLLHFRMNVIARISEFGNLLREQLNAIHGVAKNNTLVDFQFGKEGI